MLRHLNTEETHLRGIKTRGTFLSTWANILNHKDLCKAYGQLEKIEAKMKNLKDAIKQTEKKIKQAKDKKEIKILQDSLKFKQQQLQRLVSGPASAGLLDIGERLGLVTNRRTPPHDVLCKAIKSLSKKDKLDRVFVNILNTPGALVYSDHDKSEFIKAQLQRYAGKEGDLRLLHYPAYWLGRPIV